MKDVVPNYVVCFTDFGFVPGGYSTSLTFGMVQASANQNGCNPSGQTLSHLLHPWVPAEQQLNMALLFHAFEKEIQRNSFLF